MRFAGYFGLHAVSTRSQARAFHNSPAPSSTGPRSEHAPSISSSEDELEFLALFADRLNPRPRPFEPKRGAYDAAYCDAPRCERCAPSGYACACVPAAAAKLATSQSLLQTHIRFLHTDPWYDPDDQERHNEAYESGRQSGAFIPCHSESPFESSYMNSSVWAANNLPVDNLFAPSVHAQGISRIYV